MFRTLLPGLLVMAMSTSLFAQGLTKDDRIVFLGDSITQAGAAPGGYVTQVREALEKQELGAEVIGAGISGNKVPDLEKRLDRDVIAKKPTIVVIYIGINDVWHSQNDRGTPKDVYETGLKSLIERIQKAGARPILCTATVIGEKTDGSNPLDKMLDEYCDISRGVAKEAARDFLLGHMNVLGAVIFEETPGVFSDACNKAIEFGIPALMRDDWKNVFEPQEIAESIRRIT